MAVQVVLAAWVFHRYANKQSVEGDPTGVASNLTVFTAPLSDGSNGGRIELSILGNVYDVTAVRMS